MLIKLTTMKEILEQLEAACDRIVKEYVSQDIPAKNPDFFGRQLDFVDFMQAFVEGKGKEMVDIANELAENYEGDIDELKGHIEEIISEKILQGVTEIKSKNI